MADGGGNHPERSVRVSVSSDAATMPSTSRVLPEEIQNLLEHVLSPELQHQVLHDLQQHFSQQSTSQRLTVHSTSATQQQQQHSHAMHPYVHPVGYHMPQAGMHGGPGGESESLVINMVEDEHEVGTGHETPGEAPSGQQVAGINRADQVQAANLLHTFYNSMESILPFVCLLLMKLTFDHRLGKFSFQLHWFLLNPLLFLWSFFCY